MPGPLPAKSSTRLPSRPVDKAREASKAMDIHKDRGAAMKPMPAAARTSPTRSLKKLSKILNINILKAPLTRGFFCLQRLGISRIIRTFASEIEQLTIRLVLPSKEISADTLLPTILKCPKGPEVL